MMYDSLPGPLLAKVDEAAAKLVNLWDLSVEEARELVLEHLVSRSSDGGTGTGH